MEQCPKCQSMKIVKDILLQVASERRAYALLRNPSDKSDRVAAGFRIDVCGNCGYSEMKSPEYQELYEAQEKGFLPTGRT